METTFLLVREGQDLLTPAHLTDAQIERLMEILKELVFKYGELIALPKLNEAQANQLAKILDLAQDNETLSNWLTELDHASGHALRFLEPENRAAYKDYYALLKERCCHENQEECMNYQANCDFLKTEQAGSAIRKRVDVNDARNESEPDAAIC